MSRRDPRAYLLDIVAAADAVEVMLAGVEYGAYAASLEKRSAVERQLMNAGEAVARLMKVEPRWCEGLTTPERIVAFRNILVHGYYQVLPDVVWDVAANHLPILRREARAILDSHPE